MEFSDEQVHDDSRVIVQPVSVQQREAWTKTLAEFFLRLEFKYLIPARTVQYIAKEMSHVHMESVREISEVVNGVFSTDKDRSEAFGTSVRRFESAFRKLRTSHCRFDFYKDHYLFVEPKRMRLPSGNSFYYVSIKETLQKTMLSKSARFLDLSVPQRSASGILRDFYDGALHHKNVFFQSNAKAFRIILFQDGFELVNPLGSAKRKYKLLGVYMSLANYPDFMRTHTDCMQLVALCKESELQHAGVFGRIAEELKELETDGVEIAGHGKVKGSLLYVAGDNLGSHGVGGFGENFSTSTYFCRYCLVDRATFFSPNGHNATFEPRTKENYEAALLGRNVEGRKGIKFNSKLNELMHFHVCAPGLPPCLGHDILEGAAAYDIALILQYFIDDGLFTYPQLNERIASFPYSIRDRKEKPLPFHDYYERIKGKMWQVYNSIRLFPIMLADFLQDESDDAWRMLLLLGEILDILCAPSMHRSWLGHLQGLFWEYLNLRAKTFPNIPLRPKHHYLTHYCDLIHFFGPLGKVWTLRFESKHQFFKNTVRSTRNFINVMHSCSNRHEMNQAFLRAGGDMRCSSIITKTTDFHPSMHCDEIVRRVRMTVPLSGLKQSTKAELKGTVYTKGNILTLWQTQYESHVTFGRILLILLSDEDDLFFLVEVLSSQFIPVSRSYRLGAMERYHCVSYNDLPCYYPLYAYNYQGELIVKLKHALLNRPADAESWSPPEL